MGNAVPQKSTPRNTIRAEIIRFFAFCGDERHLVRGTIIELHGAWVSGDLNLIHADIPYALALNHCHFAASVIMSHAECTALYLNGSYLVNGLSADGLTTKGEVFLCNNFFAENEVRLVGANIGGQLNCRNGKFHNRDGYALLADKITTKTGVFLDNGFLARGNVRFTGASIGGNFDCSGGVFINTKEGHALYAGGMETSDSMYLKDGFVAVGSVCLTGAQIGFDLGCIGAYFDDGLMGESMKIGNMFGWREVFGKGIVNLARAQANGVSIDMKSKKMFRFFLRDFTYGQFFDTENLQSRIGWLDNWPKEKYEFTPQPYEQAAKVLFEMGHNSDAQKILLKKEQETTKYRKWEWWQKSLRWCWEKLAGYGYRPALTFCISFFVVLIGTGIFWLADCAGRIVPHQPAALANVKYQYGRIPSETPAETVARKLSGYPEFNPILFSLDIFVPLFNLHQEPFWYPSPDGGRPHWWSAPKDEGLSLWFLLEWWYWFQICLGWLLTSLFLLSVTGLLRPRQSSGGKD